MYAVAFASLAVQIAGLVGDGGILPAGEFLRLLCSLGGNRGVGYDPSGAHPEQETPDVRFVAGVFPEVWSGEPVDFVCCRHVLEHVDDPRPLLACVRRALGGRAGGRVYFEVPDADCVLRGEAADFESSPGVMRSTRSDRPSAATSTSSS